MRKRLIFIALTLVLCVVATSASALRLRAGDLVVVADGGFAPTTLPKTEDAPIRLFGRGKISTLSGNLPPILRTVNVEWDRHGSVETEGLPRCTASMLESTDVKAARRICGDSIVGKGVGHAIVKFPEQAPIPISSPITVFNGPPKGNAPTVIGHAYTTVPVPTTFIVPVVIEKINRGVYGYRTKVRIPEIAGGHGIPISGHGEINRKWTYKGKRYSFVNARCETGRLQARGEAIFSDGTRLSGAILRRCQVRR